MSKDYSFVRAHDAGDLVNAHLLKLAQHRGRQVLAFDFGHVHIGAHPLVIHGKVHGQAEGFLARLVQHAHLGFGGKRGVLAKELDQSVPFAPQNVIDGNRHTYWSTDDGNTAPELVFDLGQPATFNVISLREYLPLGQRVETFALDAWKDGQWAEFAKGTSIGNRRLVRTRFVTTEKVRLRLSGPVSPAIAEVGLYAEPATAAK